MNHALPIVSGLFVVATLLFSSPCSATWPANGLAVGGPLQDGQDAAAVPDGVGGWYVTWDDYRLNGSAADARLQRISATGDIAPGWPVDGLLVSGGPRPEIAVFVAQDGSGGAFLCWEDARDNNGDIYAQHILGDATIAPGWPPGGAAATKHVASQHAPQIVADAAGGAYLVWQDYRTYNVDGRERTYGQHLTSTGTVTAGWPQNGMEVCPYHSGGQRVIADGAGGCFMSWGDARRGGIPDGIDVFAQHLLSDGSLAPGWQSYGNLVAPNRSNAQLLPDGTGGFYATSISWRRVSTFPYEDQFFVSRYRASGVPVDGWTADGILITPTHDFRDGQVAAADSLGGVLAAWDGSQGVMAARIRPDGSVAPGWPVGGVVVGNPSLYNQYEASITPDGMGGAFISWMSAISTNYGFVQHLGSQGTAFYGWPAWGLPVSGSQSQSYPKVAHDGFGGALAYWEEGSMSQQRFGIFAQRFVTDGIVAAQLSLASSEITADRVSLVWQGAGAADLSAQVERREEGSGWRRLGAAERDGTDRLRYEDREVAPGTRYAYRLTWTEDGTGQATTESWIDIPAAATLALEGLRPNPAFDAINVSFSLPTASAASLELLDLAGRRVLDREVGSLGAGRHLVRLDRGERIAPGMYWLRLRQGERQLLARAVVMK